MTSGRPSVGGWRSRSLATRLLVGQALVLAVGGVTAGLVAGLVGPPLFHRHMLESGTTANPSELAHLDEAYASANTVAITAALALALAAAVVLTWYVGRRLTTPLTEMAEAADRLSHGDYSARVATVGAGPELERLSLALNDAASRLETTEETRRRLLADLAHELRTPLATITAYVDGLEDGVTTWDEEVSRVLHDATGRLTRLAEDLATVSRAEERGLDVAPTDVSEVVEAAVGTVREAYSGKGVRLLVDADPAEALDRRFGSGAEVELDRDRVVQVLTNLLTNALRHTPEGGSVTVATRRDGDVLSVTVADTGEGIAPDQLPHVFERFYRGDSARTRDSRGSGIGLTIARGIAAAHHGSLEAASDGPGTGSTFVLTLPVHQPPEGSTARP